MYRRWLMLVVTLLVGCTHTATVEVGVEPPPKIDTNFERLPLVLAGIQKAGDVLLHEGLPGDFWEPQLLERELKQKKTIKLHGYSFYEELLTLQGTDSEKLTALFSAKDSFGPFSSTKQCGGYHPDYCVEWKTSGGVTQALICLECGEVKMCESQYDLHCDFSKEAKQKVEQLLGPYQKNRPVPKSGQ